MKELSDLYTEAKYLEYRMRWIYVHAPWDYWIRLLMLTQLFCEKMFVLSLLRWLVDVKRNLKFKMLTVSYYYALYLKLNESPGFYLVLKQTNVSKDVFVPP